MGHATHKRIVETEGFEFDDTSTAAELEPDAVLRCLEGAPSDDDAGDPIRGVLVAVTLGAGFWVVLVGSYLLLF
jgi:hypothetical protein